MARIAINYKQNSKKTTEICGHILRMDDIRWPKKIYQWTLRNGRRRGKPQQSWKNEVTDFMRNLGMDR